jgi:hypothetical protein
MFRQNTLLDPGQDPEDVMIVAFLNDEDEPDTELSIYRTEHANCVQLRTEHCAGGGMDRPQECLNVDVSSLVSSPRQISENKWFTYASNSHHVLDFKDPSELLGFIKRLLELDEGLRTHVTRSECKDYVKARVAAEDEEWERFFNAHPKGSKWRSLAGPR